MDVLTRFGLVALGGCLGSLARYLIGDLLSRRLDSGFPWTTWVINVTGSFVLGLLVVLISERTLDPRWRLFLGIGFCGAYTTFSTFELETQTLVADGQWLRAFGNVVLSVGVGFGALLLGMALGKKL
ncbi:MAG: fluoride efflux transporter CrcB [Planctomycetes bacterium]|nr:fluoride efflux transporter CrcB [Planctomycetota bacterium]MBI3846112.1 fluoride efflux transporter CrcB [Planctomycetota bacterium]